MQKRVKWEQGLQFIAELQHIPLQKGNKETETKGKISYGHCLGTILSFNCKTIAIRHTTEIFWAKHLRECRIQFVDLN